MFSVLTIHTCSSDCDCYSCVCLLFLLFVHFPARSLHHHRNTVSSLVVAKTARQDCLISASFDGTIAVWDVTRARAFQPVPEYALRVSDQEVLAAAFHTPLGMIFTAGNDGLICMWNIESRARVAVFRGHKNGRTHGHNAQRNKRRKREKQKTEKKKKQKKRTFFSRRSCSLFRSL